MMKGIVLLIAVIALIEGSEASAQKKEPKNKRQEVKLNLDSLDMGGFGDGSAAVMQIKDTTPDPDPDEFIEVDTMPEMIGHVGEHLVYPLLASRNGIEGRVDITLLINENGDVTKTRIDQSSNRMFEQPTIDAVMNTKFKPAMRKGKPIKMWYSLPVKFRLN